MNHHATANGPVPFTPEEELEWAAQQTAYIPDYNSSVKEMLDNKAKSMGYDDIMTAISYVGDPNETFNNEAVALRDWRSVVWSTHNEKIADITAGVLEKISVEEFVALLPSYPA